MPEPTVLIAAGGTGGHVFPGLATAAALAELRPDLAIEFVGTADRLEATLVPQAGWRLHTVPTAPLTRSASPALLKLPFVLGGAVRRVVALIRSADVVAAIGFGGYTSVPLALAARLTGVPLVVHEQNAVPGIANRLAARAAAAVAISFEDAQDAFGRVRTELTGNPVRPDLLPDQVTFARGLGLDDDVVDPDLQDLRDLACATFGLDPDRRTLLVFGGSQGARRINAAVTASAGAWADPGSLQVLHAAGSRTHAETRQSWIEAGVDPDGGAAIGGGVEPDGLKVVCREFIDRMDLAYAAADVVVCRAGASSIAELTALALPSVLVPYPHATADHQTANARAVERAGGAVVVADERMDTTSLVAAAQPLLTDPDRHAAFTRGAATFGRPHAAADLAALVLEVSRTAGSDRS